MGNLFTGDQVLQMAMEMEQLGQTFYEALGQGCDDPRVSRLSQRLAKVEADHYNTFKQMLQQVRGRTVRLSDEEEVFARDLVKSHMLPDPRQVRQVAIGGNVKDALALAVRMEQDSVKFYGEMLKVVPAPDAGSVNRIIREEESHLRDLMALQ